MSLPEPVSQDLRGRDKIPAPPADDRRRAESERRLAQLAAVVETSSEALISVAMDGSIMTWNPGAERLFGHTEAEAVGRNITLIVPERDFSSNGIAGGVMREGRAMNVRTERIHKDGSRLTVAVSAAPMRNEAGGIIGVSSVIRDISDALRAEERQKLLMRELAHRGKNLLAVIQSIARHSLTADHCAASVRDGLVERIAAMARTYQSLNAEGFEGAKLSELARLELEPFSSRVRAEGPEILLRTGEAQTFGMMLHELATNAVKYGALSNGAGLVDLTWTVQPSEDGALFAFEWKESGGPPVKAPARGGFGSTLITSVVEQTFASAPVIEFARAGLRYRLEAPLSRVGRRLEERPVRARIRSPRLRAFYDAWRRPGGLLPALEDVLLTMRGEADHLASVEIDASADPPALRFLSIGRALERRLGKYFEGMPGGPALRDIPGSIEATCWQCARTREPVFAFSKFDAGGRGALVLERLVAPCSRDGRAVTHLVWMSVLDEGA